MGDMPTGTGRACIACDSRGPWQPVFERWGYQLVRCPGCGLVFQDPQPSFEQLMTGYYDEDDFARALLSELRAETLRTAHQKLRLLRPAGIRAEGLRVLDVGASAGAWLEVAAEAGAEEAVGVEPGRAASAGARERGLDVRTGRLEDVLDGLGGREFDLITFWDVLEHLADPRHELALARGLLAQGGSIAATFPNVAGLYPQLTYRRLTPRTGLWEYPELPVHLYDFAPGTARAVFGRGGLAVDRIDTYATPYSFYRTTTLSPERVPSRKHRAAFGALRAVVYPLARVLGRGNAMFVQAQVAPPA